MTYKKLFSLVLVGLFFVSGVAHASHASDNGDYSNVGWTVVGCPAGSPTTYENGVAKSHCLVEGYMDNDLCGPESEGYPRPCIVVPSGFTHVCPVGPQGQRIDPCPIGYDWSYQVNYSDQPAVVSGGVDNDSHVAPAVQSQPVVEAVSNEDQVKILMIQLIDLLRQLIALRQSGN